MTEDQRLVRGFRLGLLGVAILFVLVAGLVKAYGTGADRPEGVAERWLADVGDTTRDGVKDKARRQAEEVGPVALAADLLPGEDTDGRPAFVDLEVGKAVEASGRTLVPFLLHQRVGGDAGPAIEGTIALERHDGDWTVVEVGGPTEGLAVPSEGGDPAAKAPIGLFVGAIGLSVVVAAICGALVRAAGREAEAQGRAGTTPA